jgi:hypothetical protein
MYAMNLKIHRKTDSYKKQCYYVHITQLPTKVEAPIPTVAYVPPECLMTLDRMQQMAHGVRITNYRNARNLLHGNETKNFNFHTGRGGGGGVYTCVSVYIHIHTYIHTHTCGSCTGPDLLLGLTF